MSAFGWLEIIIVLALVVVCAIPIGSFMAAIFEGRRTFLSPIVGPLERGIYRLSGIDPDEEQDWLRYTLSMLTFVGGCFLCLYLTLRSQAVLPFNPQGRDGLAPDLSFNTAISFITNANWQAYAGETTMSHFAQMAGLTAHNFLDTAVVMALAIGLTRAFVRNESTTIGNFWVDMTRSVLYVLLPLSILTALLFVALGVPQTLSGSFEATTLEGARQTIAIGPVASQEAIKLLGNNGGGFFNVNSAHPFENPTALSNMAENWSQLVLPVAFIFAFGRMVGNLRQGRSLLITMSIIFFVSLVLLYRSEAAGNPLLTELGVDAAGGNLEGKDLRFGQAGAALFAAATTGTGTGAANAVLDSLTPIGGLVPMLNLLMGCIAPGGVGTNLYVMLLLAILSVFIAGLMVGRTPEYLGKKIEAREIRLAMLSLLLTPALVLGFAAVSVNLKTALDSLGNAGPHGFSELLYAFASTSADNGSIFGGLSVNTVWFNTSTGVVMLIGRLGSIIPIMAIAGSLARKKKAKPSSGTFPTDGLLFSLLLLGIALIITLLDFFPALTLGPLAEQALMSHGRTF
ncbi:MAG TPA: potassium-transporting ATPase subunit KdpA [Methylosinus sp.]|jgi:K+-transporting ATPase ATPase A chain|uniref:potassium-transporting ATPase subunit KdpA n=1 Tax=Methylosinus sp. TaxID=427 RepID=UPI002F941400